MSAPPARAEGPGCLAMTGLFLAFGAAALAGVEGWADRWSWPVDPAWYRVEEAGGAVTFGCQNFAPVRFAAAPAAGVTRIVVLGGSAAFGFPDRPVGDTPLTVAAHGLAGATQATLDAAWPGAFEVVNLGVNGGTSEDTLRLARRAMAWGPAALVVYDGNNEFMDVPREISPSLWRFALYRRVAVLGARVTESPGWVGPPAWTTDAARAAVHARLRHDLEAVADLAAAAHVALVLSTQAANLADFDPSWSTHGDAAALAALPERTDSEVEALYAANPDSADLAWTVGRRRLASGGDARPALEAAVDLDGMPFRPTSAVNAVIRSVAASRGLPLVDAAAAVEPVEAVPGAAAFYDWVHPRREAAAALAGAIVAGLAEAHVVPNAVPAHAAPSLPAAEAAARDVRVAVSWVQWACVRHHDPAFRLTHADAWARAALDLTPGDRLAAGVLAVTPLLRDATAALSAPLDPAVATKLASIHPCVGDRLRSAGWAR